MPPGRGARAQELARTNDPPPATFCSADGWCNPNYQAIARITSKANSTYEAAMVKLVRYGRHGISFHAHYTYAHATDWNPKESSAESGRPQHPSTRTQISAKNTEPATWTCATRLRRW